MRAMALLLLVLSGCAQSPPKNPDNLCAIFKEKRGWYRAVQEAVARHGGSASAIMSIIHQESSFRHNALPPRRRLLGFIPGPRISRVYGYAQAQPATWQAYKDATGKRFAKRDNFADAADFVAWYNGITRRRNNVAESNVEHLYLAYHEGHGGHRRGSYRSKPWLQQVARKVAQRSARYRQQLLACDL